MLTSLGGHQPCPTPTPPQPAGELAPAASNADRPHVWVTESRTARRADGQKSKGTLPDPSPAQRDGEVEDRQHERARVLGEEVSDDGGRDGRVAGLADAHQPAGEDQQPEVLWERGAGCRGTVLLLCLLTLGPRFAPHPLRGPGARMERPTAA